MHVKGKVCVVTGGASGIGEAVARAWAEAGARGVVVADLKTSRERLASRRRRHRRPRRHRRRRAGRRRQGADRGGRRQVRARRRVLLQCRPVAQGTGGGVGCRLGRELARACHEPRVCGARAGPRHARARLRLSAQHRFRGRAFGVAELDALWRDEERRSGAWPNISPFNMATAASAFPCCARNRCKQA